MLARGVAGLLLTPARLAGTVFRTARSLWESSEALGAVAHTIGLDKLPARGRLAAAPGAAGGRRSDPADARAAHAVEPHDHAAPPLRVLLAAARRLQAREDRVRHHAQRRGDGGVGLRAAPLPRGQGRAAERAAQGDGAGVGALREPEARLHQPRHAGGGRARHRARRSGGAAAPDPHRDEVGQAHAAGDARGAAHRLDARSRRPRCSRRRRGSPRARR